MAPTAAAAAAATLDLTAKPQNKRIVFNDEGDEVPVAPSAAKVKKSKKTKFPDPSALAAAASDQNGAEPAHLKNEAEQAADEDDYFVKREKKRLAQKQDNDEEDAQKKWFHVYPQFPTSEEVLDMKDKEQMELYNLCKEAYQAEMPAFNKRNPSDGRWLQTALHKGTAKDRANAGALLVTSNPLGNLEALSTLIGYTKVSNKSSTDVTAILTDLWKEVLLPPHRKLISLAMRAADWKQLRKDTAVSKEKLKRIYAYWHFENELKDHYFEFLKNLQQGIQTGQENNKNSAIVSASQLLAYAPEKEQMLLTMIINKLGDPLPKVASKALHHLTDVAHKHPNMCGVIVTEAEKLLFRNNISERAQHFALCFLSSIAPAGRPEVCTKLVHICFSLFKVLVQKGAVNNRTMQAILRCLQKAILEAKPADGSTEVLSKDMQDTIYRLVHLADIRVSVQTLGLLLQLVAVKTEKSDRFYNALYKKLLDTETTTIGTKTAAQLLHIVHRAIHIDANVQRAQAFVKRVLQLALYMPAQIAAGCLIVIHKLLRSRKELAGGLGADDSAAGDNANRIVNNVLPTVKADDDELAKFDSDGEEKYEDVREDAADADEDVDAGESTTLAGPVPPMTTMTTVTTTTVGSVAGGGNSSWHHAKVERPADAAMKVREIGASKYDPFHRAPAFAGAEHALRNELLLLREHFHPTVQVFADSILNQKRIDYYGDPLRDFGLPHFLERFAFKNPKKLDQQAAEEAAVAPKRYVSFGARGKPVRSLTKANCTEEEMFIFNFLEQKRKQSVDNKTKSKARKGDDGDDGDEDGDEAAGSDLRAGEVNDDEFEDYLDGFFGKKAKAAALAEAADEEELDFLKELGGELQDGDTQRPKGKKKKSAPAAADSDDNDEDDDWGDDDAGDDDDEDADEDNDLDLEEEFAGDDVSDDEEGSIDFNDDDDDEDELTDDQEDDDADDNDSDDSPFKSKSKAKAKSKAQKGRSGMNEKSFAKQLKHSDDMSSLFAAADDFAELLEETGKSKGQGTSNAVYNKDKSSEKQIRWEENRRSNTKTYTTKRRGGKMGGAGSGYGSGSGSGSGGKKRKH